MNNVLIEASAGTGKTQELAGRLIALLRAGVKPQEIVALTFSRAAAGEIFERFVTLLAKGVETNPSDAALLREVIATQHLSQIGTLDSFLMRIVRAFPLELGLQGPLEMMDEYAAAAERARVSFGILRRTDVALKQAFVEAFSLAMKHENVRSYIETYRTFLKDWHARFLAQPEPEAWGVASRLGLADADFGAKLSDCADALEGIVDSNAWREFVAWVRGFRGSFSGLKGFAAKFVELGEELFQGATIEIFYRKPQTFGGTAAAAVRAAMSAVYGLAVRQKLEMARGIWTLVNSFETEYAKKVRQAGRLVFDDVPRLILNLKENTRLALEYRMDSKIRAWALDEFQDTSREQWKALEGLLGEAKQSDGEKSVFIVGDRKQAIYGWRNGDVSIFTHERESGAYEVKELKKSWRYGPPVVEAVNAVFARGRLERDFPTWSSPEHATAKPGLDGFVQVVDGLQHGKMEDFVKPVLDALKVVDPVGRGLSAAILVRGNAFGELLAAELRQGGLKGVVWEGESDILDTPALGAFVDALALADHPGDRRAYEHFRRSPLAAAKFGAEVPEPAVLSEQFAQSFAAKGLVRTFRELRAALPEPAEKAWSQFSEGRFTDMLRAAAEFERTLKPGMRLSDFIAYLEAKKKRNVAEPGKIRILTIHRSKGLGFDYVVLPLYEPKPLTKEPTGPLFGPGWVLPDPGAKVTRAVAALSAPAEERKVRLEQEELCAYYVAMTRAKRAMTIVLHPAAKTETESLRISDFIRAAIPEPIGNPTWYRACEAEKKGSSGVSAGEKETLCAQGGFVRRPRTQVRRRLPSLSFRTGASAGGLFVASSSRQAALARGVEAHAAYEHIEFLAPELAKDDFDRALVKPTDFVALWRERAFEVLADGEWTSGRFDRVVFTGAGTERHATIYDFKTNRKGRDESAVGFAARMRAAYAGQMAAYRKALAALAGLPESSISCVLLLEATRSVELMK